MKKIITFFAALAAVLSCSKENPSNYNPVDGTYSVTLSASAPGADTKTTLVDGEGTKFVHWSKGDAIKVLFFPDVISVTASFSGSNGIFTSHFDEETSSTAFFRCDSWSWGSKVEELGISKSLTEKGIAVYPATATAKSTKPTGTRVICDTEVSFDLPETQTAVKDNIESNLNFSYATVELSKFQSTISNGAQTDLKFQNVCAMIELTMPSTLDKKVTSISITSNDNVPLTGKGVATMSYYKNEIDSNPNDSASDHIFKPEISEGAGVTLNNANGFEAGVKYYAVVWPGKHDGGLTIEFAAEDGTVATKTTPSVTLTASKVKPYTFNKGLDFIASVQEFDYIYADGTTGNKVQSNIVGVVIYRGNPKEKFNDPALPDQYCNGLAISTKNVVTIWGIDKSFTIPSGVKTSTANFGKGGFSAKKIITDAGLNLQIYANSSYSDLSKCNTSGWYLGTGKEWEYIYAQKDEINELLSAAQVDEIKFVSSASNEGAFWLPLVYGNTPYLVYDSYGKVGYGTNNSAWHYTGKRTARPIFAF